MLKCLVKEHNFNPSSQGEERQAIPCEFWASLVLIDFRQGLTVLPQKTKTTNSEKVKPETQLTEEGLPRTRTSVKIQSPAAFAENVIF